jgi:hypothetical protein
MHASLKGTKMSYSNLSRHNKHQKVTHQPYLNNPNEPLDDMLLDSPEAHKVILIEDCSEMRRQFRALAHELRISF